MLALKVLFAIINLYRVGTNKLERDMTKQDFLNLGGKEWVKGEHNRVYIKADAFNKLMGTSFGDSNNSFYFDCNTSALMRSYKGKKPSIEIQY